MASRRSVRFYPSEWVKKTKTNPLPLPSSRFTRHIWPKPGVAAVDVSHGCAAVCGFRVKLRHGVRRNARWCDYEVARLCFLSRLQLRLSARCMSASASPRDHISMQKCTCSTAGRRISPASPDGPKHQPTVWDVADGMIDIRPVLQAVNVSDEHEHSLFFCAGGNRRTKRPKHLLEHAAPDEAPQ